MSGVTRHVGAGRRGGALAHTSLLCIAAVLCWIVAAASVERATAADWPGDPPVLRGSVAPGFLRWDGWQVGLLAGYSNLHLDTDILNSTNGPVFGGFFGYNFQWDQLVVGFDATYKYASVLDSSSMFDTFKLVDYATFRARAGYAIGSFLPYAMLGGAIGRFNYGTWLTPSGVFVGKNNAFAAGFVTGLGVDWAITPGFFLRAEWEYVAFTQLNGIRSQTNTGLIGGGLRF